MSTILTPPIGDPSGGLVPPTPPRRSMLRRKRVWIPAAVVLALIVIGIAGGGKKTEKTSSSKTTVAAAATTAAPAVNAPATTAASVTTVAPAATAAPTTHAPTTAAPATTAAVPVTTAAPAGPTAAFNGKGDDVVAIPSSSVVMVASITHTGASNFSVILKDPDGSDANLLVNEIGDYDGTVLVAPAFGDMKDGSMLAINADGKWTIDIHPVTAQPVWQGEAIKGIGDQVLYVGKLAKTGKFAFHDAGDSNFVVVAETTGTFSSDLLINEIGPYDGNVLVNQSTVFLTITAGPGAKWSITPA